MDESYLEDVYLGDPIVSGTPIRLEQDAIVAVYLISAGDSIAFTSETTEAPKGSSAENPITCTETTVVKSVNNKDYYFVEFTAPKAGAYEISAYYGEGYKSYVRYNIDGKDYGKHNYAWLGGCSDKKPYAVVEATAGQKVLIKIDRNSEMSANPVDVTVEIAEHVEEEKSAVKLYGGVLVYDIYNAPITIAIDGMHVVYTYMGNDYEANLELGEDGKYKFNYTLEDEGQQTVTFTVANGELIVDDSYNGEGTLKALPQGLLGGVLVYDIYNAPITIAIDGMHVVYTYMGNDYEANLDLGEDGKYKFNYTLEDDGRQTVTFTVVNGELSVDDSYNGTGELKKL